MHATTASIDFRITDNSIAGDFIRLPQPFICTESSDLGIAQLSMFGIPTGHALAPHYKTGTLHVFSHQRHHAGFIQAELQRNRLEWRAIFPGHLDDAVKGRGIEFGQFHGEMIAASSPGCALCWQEVYGWFESLSLPPARRSLA